MPTELTKGDLVHLTKEWILSRVSQEDIFTRYLGHPPILTQRFRSPIRNDKHPTCTMAYFGGRLFFRDWSQPRAMDVFDFVGAKTRLPYQGVLRQIATDFDLWEVEPSLNPTFLLDQPETGKSAKKEIAVKIQPFQAVDIDFLKSFGLSSVQASKFRVFSLKYVWINGLTSHVWSPQDPVLGYYHGVDEKGSQRWKLYFYARKDGRPRFIGNTNRISGWVQLPEKGTAVVLTKSMKDVMVFDTFGVPAISMQSESTFPYPEIIEELRGRFDHIVSLYDFDYAGVTNAQRLKKTYGIPYAFLTNGRWGTVDYGAKDISDYIRDNGREATEALLIKAQRELGLKADVAWSWNQF